MEDVVILFFYFFGLSYLLGRFMIDLYCVEKVGEDFVLYFFLRGCIIEFFLMY